MTTSLVLRLATLRAYNLNIGASSAVALGQFALNSTESGSGDQFQAEVGSILDSLTRLDLAAATTVNNTEFIIDEHMNSHSSQASLNHSNFEVIPEIVSYNMIFEVGSNDTASTNVTNAFLTFVTDFGSSGLLVSADYAEYSSTKPNSITNVTIYEPLEKTWHTQFTTDNAPTVRDSACAVSLSEDNETYEMGVLTHNF